MNAVGLPPEYAGAWSEISRDALRRRARLEIRIMPQEPRGDGYVVRYLVRGALRWDDPEDLGTFSTVDAAIGFCREWLDRRPLPGPDALRDELRKFGARLAMATPRDLTSKGDRPLYRHYRDRILPLAWDNLVDSVRLEALEDYIRRTGAEMDAAIDALATLLRDEDAARRAAADLRAFAAEARGLVPPKGPDNPA